MFVCGLSRETVRLETLQRECFMSAKDTSVDLAPLFRPTSLDEYTQRNEHIFSLLHELEVLPKIVDEDQYKRYREIKSILSSMSCSMFDARDPRTDDIYRVERAVAKRLASYNKRFLISDRRHALVARYLLWRHRFSRIESITAFLAAREFGILRRVGGPPEGVPYSIVVIGLDRKEGDNVFTVDDHGRHYRQYRRTIGRQAFSVVHDTGLEQPEYDAFARSLPPLDDTYYLVAIRDAKYAARGSSFTRHARTELCEILTSQWASALRLDAPPPGVIATDAPLEPVQLVLPIAA